MANACLNPYSSSISLCKNKPTDHFFISSSSPSSSLRFPFSPFNYNLRTLRVLAVTEEKPISVATPVEKEESNGNISNKSSDESKLRVGPCELYVCNIPRSCDISELAQIFKPYGTVLSVEVTRNMETGLSKGCGHVTMGSTAEAKLAITALDGSDVGGREMRVRFSYYANSITKIEPSSNKPNKKDIIFETPHKIYVGNLPWSVKVEDLRDHFGQFGSVVSTRILYDRKGGKNRVYGFLSFSKPEECEAAVASTGTDFRGRKMTVRGAKPLKPESEPKSEPVTET